MSVRHIHASPGEYIAVHRNGGSRYHRSGSGGGTSDASGCLVLLIGVALYCFWREIIVIATIVGVLALVGWLVWRFRVQLGRAAVEVGSLAWKGIRIAAIFCWRQMTRACRFCASRLARHRAAPASARKTVSPTPSPASQPSNYGKIIQQKS